MLSTHPSLLCLLYIFYYPLLQLFWFEENMSSCCEQLGRSEKSGGNCRCFETTTTCEENSKGPGHNNQRAWMGMGEQVRKTKPQSARWMYTNVQSFPTIIIPKTTLYYSFCFCSTTLSCANAAKLCNKSKMFIQTISGTDTRFIICIVYHKPKLCLQAN